MCAKYIYCWDLVLSTYSLSGKLRVPCKLVLWFFSFEFKETLGLREAGDSLAATAWQPGLRALPTCSHTVSLWTEPSHSLTFLSWSLWFPHPHPVTTDDSKSACNEDFLPSPQPQDWWGRGRPVPTRAEHTPFMGRELVLLNEKTMKIHFIFALWKGSEEMEILLQLIQTL